MVRWFMKQDEKKMRLDSEREWFECACNDLALARLGEERKEDLAHQICFLAQQAALQSTNFTNLH